jgi:Tfp pilus assembly protein PilP
MMLANRIHLSRFIGKCLAVFFLFCAAYVSAAEKRILERYEIDDLVLAGLRQVGSYQDEQGILFEVWKACFRVPSGFYVTTRLGRIGKNADNIVEINSSAVIIKKSGKGSRGAQAGKNITLTPSQEYQCDWKNSVVDVVLQKHLPKIVHHTRAVLERYKQDELILSGLRRKNKTWQACFKTPPGFYVIAHRGDWINDDFGVIKKINSTQVIVDFVIENEAGDWEEKTITMELSKDASCDWENSILSFYELLIITDSAENEPELPPEAQTPPDDNADQQNP